MRKIYLGNIFFLALFTANQAFATNFYFHNISTANSKEVILGDLKFSYTFSNLEKHSKETFEKDDLKFYILRTKENSSVMLVEKKTRLGFLYLRYKNAGANWENTAISFRKYATYYKDSASNQCSTPPSEKNKIDLGLIADRTSKDKFAALVFDKSCSENLTTEEFDNLIAGTYKVLGPDENILASLMKPQILACVNSQGRNGPLYGPFREFRSKVSLALQSPATTDEIRKNNSIPLPISCEPNTKETQKCGATREGMKNKISLNTACLKKDPNKLQTNAQETIVHEFAHTVRKPQSFSEKDVAAFEKGDCTSTTTDLVFITTFPGEKEANLSKDKVVVAENSKSTGSKTLAGDVANPYSSFAERSATSTNVQTSIATNETSSSTTEVGGSTFSGSSGSIQQRNIASTSSLASVTNSNNLINANLPNLQQQAQYQNVKSYVDTSVASVAKKIAPIVSYVESPAFAQTLPPTSFENGNRGETTTSTYDTSTATKSASVNRAAVPTGRSSEVAASSSTGSTGGSTASANSANLGSSTSATASRKPAAVNKSASRLSSDPGLDNAYALKVRKKLLSDNAYRTELRSKGVQIEFADGYKFETPGHTVLYTEKNGVLVGGK